MNSKEVDEPLKVKCLKGSKRLIKGAIYECTRLNHGNKWKSCSIKNAGSYSDFSRFETLDGKTLFQIEPFHMKWLPIERLNKDNVKKGSVVKCNRTSSKYLVEGENYIVKDVKLVRNKWTNEDQLDMIKVNNGQNRFYSTHNFEFVDVKEQRKLKIGNIDGKEITRKIRKFESYSETKRISVLYKIVSDVFTSLESCDLSKVEVDVKELIVERGFNHNIISDDIDKYLDVNKIQKQVNEKD